MLSSPDALFPVQPEIPVRLRPCGGQACCLFYREEVKHCKLAEPGLACKTGASENSDIIARRELLWQLSRTGVEQQCNVQAASIKVLSPNLGIVQLRCGAVSNRHTQEVKLSLQLLVS
ncbi:hypothetical protein RRG08_012293 [Elysia crispata]|uniref:Uncharacterized protein n=1 Tax=Elysia crispata TaxID=231223 RepID=A0AAE1BAJ0_9GAST|nr:hypothetical protein RRG08_012293 [Elysia crispata]